MSIFKIKHWWSNNNLHEITASSGVQWPGCLKVDKFNSHTDSDCILIGEEYFLRIYKPSLDEEVSSVLLESRLNDVILQVDTGKFIADSMDRHVIILHPQSYTIYQLEKREGHTDAGEQNILKPMIKHTFSRKAYSLICGPFGNIKTRDLICIQGLDGSLSFFDQEIFLFMCIFDDVIIPGPVNYIASCDSFVVGKSTWILEIYSYQQLREYSEINLRQNKKNTPQWAYNAGEEISSVQVIQTSTNFSSIVALGERHLYCFQDNGLMKYMLKFDFVPICFCAYLIGWYYEPGSRLVVMVASDDSKLYIYEGTTLLWCCDHLLDPAISIGRCYLKSLPGGLVTLSTKGIITVSYLGTEPDLNANAAPAMNEVVDAEQVQAELETVEEDLQAILANKGDADNRSLGVVQTVIIKADVGKPTQNLFQEFSDENVLHLLMCPVVVILTCEDPNLVESIQITYICTPPFACTESTICLDGINGTEIIEAQVYLANNDSEISEMRIEILFTITDNIGKIVVLSKKVLLPISLYCVPTEAETENPVKLKIHTNHPCIEFSKIFTDFSEEELSSRGNSTNNVTFQYRSTKKNATLRASDNNYSIEANDFPEIAALLDHFIIKMEEHFTRMGIRDFKFCIKIDKETFKQITFKFLKSVETHAKDRMILKGLENELNVLQRQFTMVQKKLLVQYGSLPPGDCDPLEFLMRDTHQRLIKSVHEIIKHRDSVCRAGSTMIAMGYLIIYIFKQTAIEPFKLKLVEEMLCLTTLYDNYQEWEEAVTQSLSYILNKVFHNTEKDKEKLAPVTEQGILSHINLKRFLKQIRIVLDKLYLEGFEHSPDDQNTGTKVLRIEEFVEVL